MAFVKEIVPRPAIAWVARGLYGEKYVHLPMQHQLEYRAGVPSRVEYRWRYRGRWQRLGVKPQGLAQPIALGSEEEFIAEHYWGYASRRSGTVEYAVEHPAWRVWQVDESWLECDVAELYGPEFAPYLRVPPSSAFLARARLLSFDKGSN